jgi:hypothetical protein
MDNDVSGLNLYPNPTSGIINFTLPNTYENYISVQICNMQGQILYSKLRANTGIADNRIDIGGLPAGTYFMNLISDNNKITRLVSKY